MKNTPARGRPINQDKQQQQKEKLLTAAFQLMAQKTYKSITIRELADHAQVNSAMVAYYFVNKEGLFIALLDQMAERHFVNMQKVFQAQNPIKSFIFTMIKALSENSSFARLVHDEFLSEDSALSEAFIERFPKRMAQILPSLVLKHTGIQDSQKAKYAAFTLITMIITPFIGEPVRKKAWQISDAEIQDPQWAEHIYTTFISGCSGNNTEETMESIQEEKQ